jgi:hypothetical protein
MPIGTMSRRAILFRSCAAVLVSLRLAARLAANNKVVPASYFPRAPCGRIACTPRTPLTTWVMRRSTTRLAKARADFVES